MLKKTYKFIFVSSLIIVAFVIMSYVINKRDIDSRELSKQEMILIASQVLNEKYDLKIEECTVKYDKNNKIWNKYYAERYPELNRGAYQAIRFTPDSNSIEMGGGPYWICVDKINGEILKIDIGM